MIRRTLLGALLLATALPATAAIPEPKVEYAADTTMETAQGAMQGRVYHARGMERREMNAGGEKMVTVMRQDKKVVWMLMPEQKAYMEMAMGASRDQGDLSGWTFEQTAIGPEDLDGLKTTKSKVIAKGPRGEKMGGFWWTTGDGVAVKMDMLAVDKGSKMRMKLELKNLKVGKQDPALFEIPAGYSKMGMPGMGGMMGMPGAGAPEPGEQGTDERKKKKKGTSMPSMKDLPGFLK